MIFNLQVDIKYNKESNLFSCSPLGGWNAEYCKSSLVRILKRTLDVSGFPGVIWLTFAFKFKLLSKKPFSFYFKTYAISFIPLLVSAHLSKALDKWNAWLKGFNLPFQDPSGMNTFEAIFVDKTLVEPGKIVSLSTLSWIPLVIVSVGFLVTLIKLSQTNRSLSSFDEKINPGARLIPTIMAILVAFIFNILKWWARYCFSPI